MGVVVPAEAVITKSRGRDCRGQRQYADGDGIQPACDDAGLYRQGKRIPRGLMHDDPGLSCVRLRATSWRAFAPTAMCQIKAAPTAPFQSCLVAARLTSLPLRTFRRRYPNSPDFRGTP